MLTIIGCGNPNRGDDGAGVAVARLLMAHSLVVSSPAVRVVDAGTAGMEVMFQARGSQALIIVDASSGRAEPGAIFRVPGSELASVPEPSFTLHGFRWDHALHAGKKIFRNAFPDEVTVYLIERESIELGIGLSAAVSAAVGRVVELVAEHARAFAARARASIRIRGGSFYLSAELYEAHFHRSDSVAVTRIEGRIALAPLLEPSSGGHLAKVRNARGDRVIHAREFLLEQRVEESVDHDVSVVWSREYAALIVSNPQEASAHGS